MSELEITPGTEVEVRTHYLFDWATGFELVSVNGDWVEVRRRSDGALLPVPIPADDIRPRRARPSNRPIGVPRPGRRT